MMQDMHLKEVYNKVSFFSDMYCINMYAGIEDTIKTMWYRIVFAQYLKYDSFSPSLNR